MDKRPLAVISVFFMIGIVLGRFLPDSVSILHVFVVTLILITLTLIFTFTPTLSHKWERGKEKGAHVFLFLSVISVGALLYLNSNIFPPNNINYFLEKDKLKAEIIGTIKGPAETRGAYYGKVRSRYVFELEAMLVNGERFTVSGLSQIKIQTEKDYQYGDRLMMKGTIRNPKFKSQNSKQTPNPKFKKTNFDYAKYLGNQNIFAIINASEKSVTLLSRNYRVNPVIKFAYFVREKLKNMFLEKMPLESGAFLRAILLGDRSELPKKLNESFRNSGTMHILPVQYRAKHIYPS